MTVKSKKISELHCVRVLLTGNLLKALQKEADKERRKLSPMLRLILEERYTPCSTSSPK
jgi:hypothetical protein